MLLLNFVVSLTSAFCDSVQYCGSVIKDLWRFMAAESEMMVEKRCLLMMVNIRRSGILKR